jgi:hypothetical protein
MLTGYVLKTVIEFQNTRILQELQLKRAEVETLARLSRILIMKTQKNVQPWGQINLVFFKKISCPQATVCLSETGIFD